MGGGGVVVSTNFFYLALENVKIATQISKKKGKINVDPPLLYLFLYMLDVIVCV